MVKQHCIFNTEVLEAMHQLRHIMLHNVIITAQPGKPRTRHLANMPQLQHLELPMYDDFYDGWQTWQHQLAQPLTLRNAEAPSLASSSQLTHLSVGHDFGSMDAACYSFMFTPRSVPAHSGAPAQFNTLGPLAPHCVGFWVPLVIACRVHHVFCPQSYQYHCCCVINSLVSVLSGVTL